MLQVPSEAQRPPAAQPVVPAELLAPAAPGDLSV